MAPSTASRVNCRSPSRNPKPEDLGRQLRHHGERFAALGPDQRDGTYWEDGKRKERYFKGANKIFNLSVSHPVGLMIYASGSLQGMPWEVAVKAYRDARGVKGLDNLADYPKDFFKYLGSKALFSAKDQERHMVHGVSETAGNIAGGNPLRARRG